MTRSFITAVLLASLLAPEIHGATPADTNSPGPSSPAPSTTAGNAPTGLTLDAFRLIAERNIFNPNRSGRTPEREVTRREPERRVRTESISLVGTISYDKGDFAFFDGSSSSYHRAVKSSETIADLTVTSITPTQVILRSGSGSNSTASTNASDTNAVTLTLPVGMQLRRQDDGPWELAARTETAPSASSSATALPAGSEDVLKRLMQQREKEGGGDSSAASTAPAAETAPAAPATVTSPATSPAPGGGGPENEILKRLMQRREKGE